MCKINVLNQGYVTVTIIIIQSEFCDLYAYAQSISLLWYKFQTITLKTVEVAATQTSLESVMDGWNGWTYMEDKTICPPPLCGGGIKMNASRGGTEWQTPL